MIDETGNKYGKLTVIKYDHTDKKQGAYWLCACDCGLTTVVKGNRLRNGKTKSCGCMKHEWAKHLGEVQGAKNANRLRAMNKTDEHRRQAKTAATTHDGTHEHLYRIWAHMRERCSDPNGDHSQWYHDKGIRVCEEWDSNYAVFRKWAFDNGYHDQPENIAFKDKLSIDRIDPDKGYCPENCQWITVSENSSRRNQCNANQR